MIEFYEYVGDEYDIAGTIKGGEVTGGDIDWVADFIDKTEGVSLDDEEDVIQRVSNHYFVGVIPSNGTESLATQYDEGDEVDTPSGIGVVVEIRTEDFEGPSGDMVEASEDSPAYIVGVEEGAEVFRASDITEDEIEVDVENPEEALISIVEGGDWEALQPDTGLRFDYPPSWRKSPQPNRLILLKAWAGLGGRFTSCRREMVGEVAAPSRFCASMKDRVLEWEGWRQGG